MPSNIRQVFLYGLCPKDASTLLSLTVTLHFTSDFVPIKGKRRELEDVIRDLVLTEYSGEAHDADPLDPGVVISEIVCDLLKAQWTDIQLAAPIITDTGVAGSDDSVPRTCSAIINVL